MNKQNLMKIGFGKKNKINLLKAYIERINFSNKTLHLKNSKEKEMHYDILILATGSKPIFFKTGLVKN